LTDSPAAIAQRICHKPVTMSRIALQYLQ
jgi:hypothetical protein